MPTPKSYCGPSYKLCPAVRARRHNERLRGCDRFPRGMGALPAAALLPPLRHRHPQRFVRLVRGVPRRHAAAPVPRPRARQPHRGVEELQHPAGGAEPQRRAGTQQVLQIQTS